MNGWRETEGERGKKTHSMVTIEIHSGFILILTNVIKLHLTLSFSLSLQLLGKKRGSFGIRFLTETFT